MAHNEDIQKRLGILKTDPPTSERSSYDSSEMQEDGTYSSDQLDDESTVVSSRSPEEENPESLINNATVDHKNCLDRQGPASDPEEQIVPMDLSFKPNINLISTSIFGSHPSVSGNQSFWNDTNYLGKPDENIQLVRFLDDIIAENDLIESEMETHEVENAKSFSDKEVSDHPFVQSEVLCSNPGNSETDQAQPSSREQQNVLKKSPAITTVNTIGEWVWESISNIDPAHARETVIKSNSTVNLESHRNSSQSIEMHPNFIFPDFPSARENPFRFPELEICLPDSTKPSEIELEVVDVVNVSEVQSPSQTLNVTKPNCPPLLTSDQFTWFIHLFRLRWQSDYGQRVEAELQNSSRTPRGPTFGEFYEALQTRNAQSPCPYDFDKFNEALEQIEANEQISEDPEPSTSRGVAATRYARYQESAYTHYRYAPLEDFRERTRVDPEVQNMSLEDRYKEMDKRLEEMMKDPSRSPENDDSKKGSESSDGDKNKALASSGFRPKRRKVLSSDSEESKVVQDCSLNDEDVNKLTVPSDLETKIDSPDSEDSKMMHQSQDQATHINSTTSAYSDESREMHLESSGEMLEKVRKDPSQSPQNEDSSRHQKGSESSDDDINKALASNDFISKRLKVLSSDSEESKIVQDCSSNDDDVNKTVPSDLEVKIDSSNSEDSKAIHQSPEQVTHFNSSPSVYSNESREMHLESSDEMLERVMKDPPQSQQNGDSFRHQKGSESSDDDIKKALASNCFRSQRRKVLSSDSEESKVAQDCSSNDDDVNKTVPIDLEVKIDSSNSDDSKAIHLSPEQATHINSSTSAYSNESREMHLESKAKNGKFSISRTCPSGSGIQSEYHKSTSPSTVESESMRSKSYDKYEEENTTLENSENEFSESEKCSKSERTLPSDENQVERAVKPEHGDILPESSADFHELSSVKRKKPDNASFILKDSNKAESNKKICGGLKSPRNLEDSTVFSKSNPSFRRGREDDCVLFSHQKRPRIDGDKELKDDYVDDESENMP